MRGIIVTEVIIVRITTSKSKNSESFYITQSYTNPVIKPRFERNLYYRTIAPYFKRHKICRCRRTGFHAGI